MCLVTIDRLRWPGNALLFVAVLGASNYTFAEATRTQTLPDFCASTVRAFEFFGCTPKIAVPDQLRSAVSGPDEGCRRSAFETIDRPAMRPLPSTPSGTKIGSSKSEGSPSGCGHGDWRERR